MSGSHYLIINYLHDNAGLPLRRFSCDFYSGRLRNANSHSRHSVADWKLFSFDYAHTIMLPFFEVGEKGILGILVRHGSS